MATRSRDLSFCKCLLVADVNLLDQSFAARSDRALLSGVSEWRFAM